jgi:hypothetical protein
MNSLGDDFYPEEEEKKSNSYAVAFWILFVSLATGLLCVLVHRYRRRRLIQKNAAISSSLQWTPAYKDRASNEINIAPGSSYSDVYEEATREAFGRSSRDPMVTAVGAATSVSALQLEQKVSSPEIIEHDTDGDDFPDDLRSEPKIDIGPPIDEDGNELHNVEIV